MLRFVKTLILTRVTFPGLEPYDVSDLRVHSYFDFPFSDERGQVSFGKHVTCNWNIFHAFECFTIKNFDL